jgi:hypothetical protein
MKLLIDHIFSELELIGTPEELDALGDALKLKAKLGNNFSCVYTGIEDIRLTLTMAETTEQLLEGDKWYK